MAKSSAGTPATVALTRAGVSFTSHAYTHEPGTASYGLEAAGALGFEPGEVFKTLLVTVEGLSAPAAVGIVPVDRQLDLKAMAAAVGGKRAAMCDPTVAARLTGYVVGGISPIGQKRALPTVLDIHAEALATIYVSGGRRGLDLGLAPADLIAMIGGSYAAIAR